MTPDRERKDDETRSRVIELAAANEAWRERVDSRLRRVAWLLIGGMVATGLLIPLGYYSLQGQRWAQTRDACERTNRQTDATVRLLVDLKADPQAVLVAQFRYPHVPPLAHRAGARVVAGAGLGYSGPLTCSAFASERVRGPRL